MAIKSIRTCLTHGDVIHNQYASEGSRWRCLKCNVERVQKRREKLKILSLEYKGGKCEFCGYSKCVEALEFHHIDSLDKDFGISESGNTRSFEKLKIELDKCVLLCANCHREEHVRLRKLIP
jgi:5-methylcytosine-specific restriction endonuclease McrA